MEVESDLRVVSDKLLQTLEQLESLENEKRELTPGSPRFLKLASEVERLAAVVFAQTHAQQRLGEQALAMTERTGIEAASINEAQPSRELHTILSEWRDAERRLSSAEPDTAEHAQAVADIGRLRAEYHQVYSAGSANADTSN